MRAAALTLTLLALAAVFSLMVFDAAGGGDWPGWDEGWALFAFPLGVPLAIVTGLAASDRFAEPPGIGVRSVGATLAVWCWGAALFAVWYGLGL